MSVPFTHLGFRPRFGLLFGVSTHAGLYRLHLLHRLRPANHARPEFDPSALGCFTWWRLSPPRCSEIGNGADKSSPGSSSTFYIHLLV